MRRVSAATWQRMVLVPWPNSVEETRMRGRPRCGPSTFDLDERVEAALAGAGEAGAVHEGGEADAALDGRSSRVGRGRTRLLGGRGSWIRRGRG